MTTTYMRHSGPHTPIRPMSVQRLRHRYGEILREEVANTVSSPDDVESELRYLLTVLEG